MRLSGTLWHKAGRAIVLAALGFGIWASPALAVCSNNMAGVPGQAGEVEYFTSTNRLMYCDNTNWIEMKAPDPIESVVSVASGPTGCPNIGDTCSDGTKYAGLSPDGYIPMYTTPADATQTTWNNGSSSSLDSPVVNCTNGSQSSCNTGAANTTLLANLSNAHAPYRAAQYCENLVAHGAGDWYLPATNEFSVLANNQAAIGGFTSGGTVYYIDSSGELGGTQIVGSTVNPYNEYLTQKNSTSRLRCVRKVAPAAPTGCPNIGNTCSDGSVYVGISPDGNQPMYMTTAAHQIMSTYGGFAETGNPVCDAGGTNASCRTGAANTAALAALSTVQTVPRHCNNLVAHGNDDWYLPSRDEMRILFQMHNSVGSDLTTAADEWWWSSSESTNTGHVWTVNRDSVSLWPNGWKGNTMPARCVRKVQPLDPVGYWRLNETSGTAVIDSSSNAFNGTMQGGMNGSTHSVAGVKGTALNFNGTNNYINIPHNAAMSTSGGSFSVAAWVRSTIDTDENQRIVSKWGPGGNLFNLMYSTYDYGGDGSDNQAAFEVSVGGTNYLVEAENNVARVADGQWHHLVGVYDGSTIRIYTDGVLRNSRNVSGALANSTAPINFGRDANNYGFFGGNIDDVRFYHRALSAAEISSMMGASCTGAGTVYYDTTLQTFRWCNGSLLNDMGNIGLGGADNCKSTIPAGSLDYLSTNNTYYYCNGNYMVPVGRSCTACGGASNRKVAFVTSQNGGGNKGGIAGANAICQAEANAAGLSGTYAAWLADSTTASAPATRFSAAIRGGAFSIVRPDGVTVASNWSDLIDGTLTNPITLSAYGVVVDSLVSNITHTNVANNGTRVSGTNHCSNFTSTAGNIRRGQVDSSTLWTNNTNGNCAIYAHMYCFEQ